MISLPNDCNSVLTDVSASTLVPMLSSLISTPAMTCLFLSQNRPLSSHPIRVQDVIFREAYEALDILAPSPPPSDLVSLPLWLTLFQEYWFPCEPSSHAAASELLHSVSCVHRALVPECLTLSLPSGLCCDITFPVRPSLTTLLKIATRPAPYADTLFCSRVLLFPIAGGTSGHHFCLTLLHGDADMAVKLRPSPVLLGLHTTGCCSNGWSKKWPNKVWGSACDASNTDANRHNYTQKSTWIFQSVCLKHCLSLLLEVIVWKQVWNRFPFLYLLNAFVQLIDLPFPIFLFLKLFKIYAHFPVPSVHM